MSGRFTVFLLLLLGTFARPSLAQEPAFCGEALEVRLSTREPVQGSLVLVWVRATSAVARLKASWAGRRLSFWREEGGENAYGALLGVDLGRRAGIYLLTLSATLESGERHACSVQVTVREADFGVEELSLPRSFVELARKDLGRSRREARHLREILARVTPERLWQGSFLLPLDGVEPLGNFGRRRILNDQPRSPHGGEDFAAPAGTPVRAAQRGRVVLARELFFSGNTVLLDHGLGLYTWYGHLQSLAVEEGTVVEAGAQLGTVGASGRATAPHLHWAARLNRARVNPRDLVVLWAE